MMEQKVNYRNKWLVLISVGMGIFLGTIDSSIVNVALPTLVRELNTDFATVQWVVLAYLLVITSLILSASRLADIHGKKPIYSIGFIVFTIGSFLCGISGDIYWLITARVVQAIGATMVTSLGMAIITEAFPPEERGRALGLSGTIVSIGVVIGPTVGGLLINSFSWHWIFFVNLPIGILGILMVLRFVPDFRPRGKQPFDYLGGVIFFFSIFTFLLGLTYGQQEGFGTPIVFVLIIFSIITMVVFVLIELRQKYPMIDLRILTNQVISISLVARVITFIGMAGTILIMPFYLENVLGFDPQKTGLMMAAVPISLGITSPISGYLSDRFGTKAISLLGLGVFLVGFISASSLSEHTSEIGYLLRFIPIGMGIGIFQSPNNSAVMGEVPREKLGIASGILAITRTLGQTVGISIIGALWTARTFFHLGEVIPGGATEAPIPAQISGLHDAILAIVGLIVLGIILLIRVYWKDRNFQKVVVESE